MRLHLQKVESIEAGDSEAFDQANQGLLALSEEDQPEACHLVAVELYKTSQQMVQQKYKKDRKAMKRKAYSMF